MLTDTRQMSLLHYRTAIRRCPSISRRAKMAPQGLPTLLETIGAAQKLQNWQIKKKEAAWS